MNIYSFKYYYFIGIGGIGMSALARYFKKLNKSVLGYDRTETSLTKTLEKEGFTISYKDDLLSIPKDATQDNTLVIFTPAIPRDSKILNYFEQNEFSLFKRSQILGKITENTFCLAIAGTHGKTTTTSILGHLLKIKGKPVTAFIGGISENYNSNLIFQGDEISVVEADEYDRSFLRLHPDIAGITSMDADHLDIYGNAESIEKGFKEFASLAKKKIIAKSKLPIDNALHYDIENKADFYADNIEIRDGKYYFDFFSEKYNITKIPIETPGKHNIENAVLAISMALECGLSPEDIREGMKSYKGVSRRFSKFVDKNGKIIIDDYAHHPNELKNIIRSVKELYPTKKILGVFQPHLFSRTKDFANEFAESLSELENLLLLDIYPAREKPMEGITSEWLASKIKTNVELSSLENALDKIQKFDFDVLLLMGAGSIGTLYETLKSKYHEA